MDKVSIAVRVDQPVRGQLEEIARKRRMDTGEPVSVSDLVREALTEYTKRHQA